LDVYLGTGSGFVKAGKLPGHTFWIANHGVQKEGILEDLNGDGIADFSKASCWQYNNLCSLDVYLGATSGNFISNSEFTLPEKLFWVTKDKKTHIEAVIRDFNGDGISDFIKAARWHTQATDITLHTGNRKGYEAKGKLPDNKFVFWIADPNWQIEGLFADFNADGKLDFCKATIWDDGHKDYWVHLGTDSGFTEQGSFEIPTNIFQGNKGGARSGEVLDVNADGKADVVKIIEEGGRKRLDIYLSKGNGFVKRESNVRERKLSGEQKTFKAWIEDGIFGSHIIDTGALVDSMNLFPEKKTEKVYSFLFPKQKQDEKKEQLQQRIKNITEQKKQFLQEKKEVFKRLEQELDEIYKKIEPYKKEIKEEDRKSEPHGGHAANIAGHGNPSKEHLGECMWRVSPNPYSDEACKRKISEKRRELAALENEKIAKAAEIKQQRDLAFEQNTVFDTERLKLEKQIENYEQLGIEVEEEEIVVEEILQEDMTSPDFVKNDEYYGKYEL